MRKISFSSFIFAYRAAALVHPDAALLLLYVSGFESQEVLSCTQSIIITQHTHNQVERVAMQHILTRGTIKHLVTGLKMAISWRNGNR